MCVLTGIFGKYSDKYFFKVKLNAPPPPKTTSSILVLGNIKLLKRLVYVLEIKGEIKKICRQIPKQYDEKLVNKWKNEYNLIFKKI